MAENSKIEWCDHTFNPWIGCTKVSPACDHCYAERSTPSRSMKVMWGPHAERHRTAADTWAKPKRWNDNAEAFQAQHGRRQRVFCASLADVFDNQVPPAWRAELFALINQTRNLDWLLLTKRIGNVATMLEAPGMQKAGLPPNVWLGATVVNQEEADRDIPKLLATPAAVRFLSIEPMLGPIDLRNVAVPAEYDRLRRPWDVSGYTFNALQDHDDDRFHQAPTTIDWVIAGGESGPGARPAHPGWFRSLRDQCAAAGVPYLFKQWGEWTPGENVERQRGTVDTAFWDDGWSIYPLNLATDDGHIDDQPDLYRVGKKEAGRRLDGVTHDGFPA